MDMSMAIQRAATRSNTVRRAPDIRCLPARALSYLLQCVLALVVSFLHRWAPRDPGGLYWALRARLDKRYAASRDGLQYDVTATRILGAAAAALHALPPRSRESKAIRALLGAAGRHTLEAGLEEAEGLGGEGGCDGSDGSDGSDLDAGAGAGAGAGAETLTHHAYSRARADFRHMTCGTTLEHQPGSRLARSDAAVQTVVDFMYRSDNTSTLSWGSTRVDLGGGRVEIIQARNRLQSLGRLWVLYDREMTAAGVLPRDRVQRTMFYELAGAITARDLKVGGGEWCWGTDWDRGVVFICPLNPGKFSDGRFPPPKVIAGTWPSGLSEPVPIHTRTTIACHTCVPNCVFGGIVSAQARGTCDAKVLQYGAGTFAKLRALVVTVLGPQNAAAPADPTTAFLTRVDRAERFLKHEYKAHVMQVRGCRCGAGVYMACA